MSSSDETTGLTIICVGGGLAGLAAAGWLRKQHKVIVLERGKLSESTSDYGMSIVSNAMNLLLREGVDPVLLDSVLFTHTWMSNSDGTLIRSKVFDTTETFGTSSVFTKRNKLHAELLRFATSTETENAGQPAIIVEEAKVVRIEPEEGLVMLKDGREFRGDVIVGSDGIGSATRGVLFPEARVKPSGVASVMSVVPLEVIRADPFLSTFVEGVAGLSIFYGPSHLRASFFPMDNKGNIQVVGSVPEDEWTEQFDAKQTSILKGIDPAYALDKFEGFHPSIVKLFGSSISGKHDVWRIRDIDPLQSWSVGRVILIGDAAHATTPQSASRPFRSHASDPLFSSPAIEDAEALAFLLRDLKKGSSSSSISAAFATFEALRRPRATYVQETSRMGGGMLQGEEAKRIGPFDPVRFAKVIYSYRGAQGALKEMEEGRSREAEAVVAQA